MNALCLILAVSVASAQLATGGAPFKSEHVTLDGPKYENRYLGFSFEIPQACHHREGVQVIAYPALQPTTPQERSGMLLASNPPMLFAPGVCALAVQVDGSSRAVKPRALLERMLKSAKDIGKTGHMGRSNFQLVRRLEKVKAGMEMWRTDYTLDEQLRSGGIGLRYTVLLAGEFRGTTVHWAFIFSDAVQAKEVMDSFTLQITAPAKSP